MSLGGLDIGTSGCKCTIFCENGFEVASAYEAYTVTRNMGMHEISFDAIWKSVKHVLSQAVKTANEAGNNVKAICVSSFGETCVALDAFDKQAIPSFLYTDSRGVDEANELDDKFGSRKIFDIGGHKPGYMYTLPKLMWAKKHISHEYEKINKILPIHSAIIYMLTGETVTDPSLASRTMMFDIRGRNWDKELMEQADMDITKMPSPVDIGAVAGSISKAVSKELNISGDLIIVVGAQDQIVAAIGAGTFNNGQAVNGSGSVECITPVFSKIPASDIYYNGNYCVVPMLSGLYVTYAFVFSGGVLLEWYRSKINADTQSPDEFDNHIINQPTGILSLPHFSGAATPYMNNDAKGAIIGLTLEHTAADIYRALQEGLCYESLININNLKDSGIVLESLKITGGGAKSAVWNQMKADIYGIPCKTLLNKEAGATGSAMLAGVALGEYSDLSEASDLLVKEGVEFTPNLEMTHKYKEQFERYKKLYSHVQKVLT